MSTVQTLYPVGSVSIPFNPGFPAGASSSNFTAGVESDSISNVSNLDLDHIVTGLVEFNNPAAGSQCQIWVVPCQTDDLSSTVTWPDVFDGTASLETVTSYGVLQGCGRLAAVLSLDVSGTNDYLCEFSVASLFGGVLPTRYVLFLTQNSTHDFANGGSFGHYQRFQATVS